MAPPILVWGVMDTFEQPRRMKMMGDGEVSARSESGMFVSALALYSGSMGALCGFCRGCIRDMSKYRKQMGSVGALWGL